MQKETQKEVAPIHKKEWQGSLSPSLHIDFPNTTINTQETSSWRRLIIEGIEMRKLDENKANLQTEFEIYEYWMPHLEKRKLVFQDVGYG